MVVKPNKAETAVHGCRCSGDMAMSMRKVLAIPFSFFPRDVMTIPQLTLRPPQSFSFEKFYNGARQICKENIMSKQCFVFDIKYFLNLITFVIRDFKHVTKPIVSLYFLIFKMIM